MPMHVRDAIDGIAGSPVVSAVNLDGGFSPGPAAQCVLADDRVVFVKAAGVELNVLSPGMHRREGEVLAALGVDVPAPALIGAFDDGNWVALVIEWVSARMPTAPLGRDDVSRLLDVVERLSFLDGGDGLKSCFEAHSQQFGHWQLLLDEPLDGLDTWSLRHIEALASLEANAAEATQGDRLVHMDLRSDNVVFAESGAKDDVVVDWPGACVGASWIDLVGLLPSLELDGGPPPVEAFESHPIGRHADAESVSSYLASIAGFFTRMSLLPPPPGLPTLRQFQAAQGQVARRWLAERRGWRFDDSVV